MTIESKQKLKEVGRQDLIDIYYLNRSGYAGMSKEGMIVDRRQYPDAIPVQKNTLMGIPEPKGLEELKTSAEWAARMPEHKIINPDGWDKRNFHHSWFREEITVVEFVKRRNNSTSLYDDSKYLD